jgi:hypothetical protein
MSHVSVTIPKGCARQFEDLLMDYQRTHNRGQFGASLILGGISEDLRGNLTYPLCIPKTHLHPDVVMMKTAKDHV